MAKKVPNPAKDWAFIVASKLTDEALSPLIKVLSEPTNLYRFVAALDDLKKKRTK